jgi:hypothetical protein
MYRLAVYQHSSPVSLLSSTINSAHISQNSLLLLIPGCPPFPVPQRILRLSRPLDGSYLSRGLITADCYCHCVIQNDSRMQNAVPRSRILEAQDATSLLVKSQ